MNVAAVSHFVDDATASGVAPDTSPTVCSWITPPSAPTIRIMPPDNPAVCTRSSSRASVESKAPGVKTFRDADGAAIVVVAATVVELGLAVDSTPGRVGGLDDGAVDDPQPTSSSPAATNAATPVVVVLVTTPSRCRR